MNKLWCPALSVSVIALAIGAAWAGKARAEASDLVTPAVAAVVKAEGTAAANQLPPQLDEIVAASGLMTLENPSPTFSHYGFATDAPMVPAPGALPQKGKVIEATKTEPDKNTYLVLNGQTGAAKGYDYGTHFLFQGHESGPKDAQGVGLGLLTRINLDADVPHRVTLMAERDVHGDPVPMIDGSTWDPFAKRLLLTSEEGREGGVWQATTDFPSKIEPLAGLFGHASYEGVQVDATGAIWLVEDEGGKKGKINAHAKQPNSFIYRFTPKDPAELAKGGRLEALQIIAADGQPIAFHQGEMDADILSPQMKALHSFGQRLKSRWIVVHDTDADGMEPFDANAAAKAKAATPLKRPENAQFRPGTGFREFYITETGDTNADSEAGADYGGFGGVLKLVQADPAAAEGEVSIVMRGDLTHTGLDNITFLSADTLVAVEDAGDGLHSQRNAFDSAYAINLKTDYSKGTEPLRLFAIGRDALATIDSALSAGDHSAFQNEGDNEITGIHVSDGDPSVAGLIGSKIPTPFRNGWRVFYTQQHGENVTWEIISRAAAPTN